MSENLIKIRAIEELFNRLQKGEISMSFYYEGVKKIQNQESLPKNRWKHVGKELTESEVHENRSSKYEFLDFGKGETIEEVAFQYTRSKSVKEMPSQMDFINGAKFGAKWQAERMFSKDDLKLFFEFLKKNTPNSTISGLDFEKKFQEFKEKK